MLKIIREILLKIVNDIDTGNSNLSPEECEEVIEYLSGITNKNEKLSKYQACKYLKVSRATFDNYVKAKKIPNVGITYSNFKHKCSIVVIGLTTSAEEFQNTFDHEKGHLAMHISSALKIKPYGEEYQYLTGEIGQSMFKIAKRFLCDDCRQKLVIEIKEIDKKD